MESYETERRKVVELINSSVASNNPVKERERLEKEHGDGVYDTEELQEKFEVRSFLAPFIFATEKATGKTGTLCFQHSPRFYFGWEEA